MHPTITINCQPIPQILTPRTQNYIPFQHIYSQQVCQSTGHIQAPPLQQVSLPMPPPSKFISSYVIDYNRKVGNGNFSHVYVAIDQRQPNIKLAVKVINVQLLRQQGIEHLAKAQVQVLLAMRHQNILYCKDVFWDQTYCYIFTEFCEGGSLQSKIKKAMQINQPTLNRNFSTNAFKNQMNSIQPLNSIINHKNEQIYPSLTQKEMLPLIKDIFQAMLYLEKNNIIHRDIKAANIFLKENRAIVADFGFARYVYEPFTDLNIGSLPYMAPEILSKNLYSNKTDVWAFGVLLYEIFHGESPYAKSHDIQQLIQKVYTPLSVAVIRSDLTTQMRELMLNCLEIDMEKRKKFSQLEQTWYYKKLFDNVGHYTYGYNVSRNKNININNQTIIGQTEDYGQNKQQTNILLLPNKIVDRNLRSFGSRFKQKINIGNLARGMNYSYSESKSKSKEKQQNIEINKFEQEKTLRQNPKERPVTPKPVKTNVYKINFTVTSPAKQENSISPQHINEHIDSQNPNLTTYQIQQPLTPQQIFEKQASNLTYTSTEPQKIPFKDILLRIQEIRNYYKLAILLKDRNRRIIQIKNRLFIKSVKQIRKIERLVEKNLVDLSTYGKKQKSMKDSTTTINRKAKLASIVKDYKIQFENQLKRRNININCDTSLISSGYFINKEMLLSGGKTQQNSNDDQLTKSGNIIKGDTMISFKSKAPSLSQDIQYVVQTQLLYHAQDTLNQSYEQCQAYRNRVKEILEDIMHVQHGYLTIQSINSSKKFRPISPIPSHVNSQNIMNNDFTIQNMDEAEARTNINPHILQKHISLQQFNNPYQQFEEINNIKLKQKSTYH